MIPWLLLTTAGLANDGAAPEFYAGSYGRVQALTDVDGGSVGAYRVASYAPRLELGPYLELDLGWRAKVEGAQFNVLITPALASDLFHYDGRFSDDLALRNFFAEASDFVPAPLTVWAGSRMYRGDDVYLLDFWPLDNLNTYGGGLIWAPAQTEVAGQVGVNRLQGEDWQLQTRTVQDLGGVYGEEVVVLDRQRTIASLRLTQRLPVGEQLTLRLKAYAEVHALPEGERQIEDPFSDTVVQTLPAERGGLVGAQVSLWGWAPQSFVHLWVRRSTGLAAYGELSVPQDGLALDLSTRGAGSFLVATAGNTESERLGLVWGAYLSQRNDADGQVVDFDDRWEAVAAVRPQVYLSRTLAFGIEASHQVVRPNGLNPRTARFDRPNVTKLSLLPAVQASRGSFTRPRIHAVYTLTLMDEAARRFFSPADVRIGEGPQHYVGLGAEWWLNSQRVITPL
jgi:maltoporin